MPPELLGLIPFFLLLLGGLGVAIFFIIRAVVNQPPPMPSRHPVAAEMPKPEIELPPSTAPESSGPVKGLMRVDVTETDRTVDVYITLSEQARFVVNDKDLGSIPIEQNFENLSKHMAEFKSHLHAAYNQVDADVGGSLRGDDREYWNKVTKEWRDVDRYQEPQKLAEEERRYRERNTVYLRDYLRYPYRKVVGTPIEAAAYMKRLETEYLPKIKIILEKGSTPRTKSFEF